VDRKTVAWDGVPEVDDRSRAYVEPSGWGAFLGSWKLGVLLVTTCLAGVIAILGASPFAAASVNERVTTRVGQAASCIEVGAARVAGVSAPIYRCTIGLKGPVQCFVVSGQDVRQFGRNRGRAC
jgi:hypothetical protein